MMINSCEKRSVLLECQRHLLLESHVLREKPALLFQQLYNELQWKKGQVKDIAENARKVYLAGGRRFYTSTGFRRSLNRA